MIVIPEDSSGLTRTCCGIVQGFLVDDMVRSIVAEHPEESYKWFLPERPPVIGQKVKVQVNTKRKGIWARLTGDITKIREGVLEAVVEQTTVELALPEGPYLITLAYDETMKYPWVLTSVELLEPDWLRRS